MGKSILGSDSLLDDSSVATTASVAADAAFPLSNLNNDRPWSPYKMGSSNVTLTIESDAGVGNTKTVDYFMLVGHDLFDPAEDGLGPITSLFFERSADAAAWSTVFSIVPGSTPVGSIADNNIIARFLTTPIVDRAFRLRLERPANAFIATLGEMQYGKAVVFPVGMPRGVDPSQEVLQMRRTQSQTGQILGTVERYSDRRQTINMPFLPSSFVNGTDLGEFKDWWDNEGSKGKGFLWHWNPDSDPDANPGAFEKDAFFAIVEPDSRINRPFPTQLATGLRDVIFSILGPKEE